MKKRKDQSSFKILGCAILVIFLVIACACTAIIFLALAESEGFTNKAFIETVERSGDRDEKIAIINLEGMILNVEDGVHEGSILQYIVNALDKVNQNEDYKAVIIKMNTPGGGVYDSARISEKIKEVRANDKLVISVIEEMSASGGYWIAAGTDYIFVQPESITGSIGVLFQTIEYEELFQKIGLKEIIITNKEAVNKVPENLDDKESEQYKIFEKLLNEEFEAFVKIILQGRNLKREDVSKYLDGRLVSGREAIKGGLADEFGGYEEAINYIENKKGLDKAHVVNFSRKKLIGWNSFSSKLNIFLKKVNPQAQTSMKMYLLPEIMFKDEK